MAWIQIRLNATNETAETISDELMELGAASVTFVDAQDTPVFEPLPGETRLWGDTDVIGLFDAVTDMAPVIDALKAMPELAQQMTYKVEALEDKDWEREWMDNFHPMQFGRRLWICPSWREAPEPDAVNVMLDPGLAFGTGTHPTTALCLTWLDGLELGDKSVVDFGCGSGILAIAAIKLGAQSVVGLDIDPQALTASADNAQRNGVEEKLTVYLPKNQPDDLQADVVVANILAGPLRELAPVISALVKPGGQLALSGLLVEQAEELRAIYGQWFDLNPTAIEGDWCRLDGQKRID
ncbi:(LSU ribosomal protein L11P)-lysine N-methyltransferase [Ferrimonas balearica DSM 9799]|uniref:Ribosomal protein L11 methyltransferase n=1 Tax=Ferrimonas balearica (strain DSM 9799 / CCM 4581 / KCTC 23876 / PAT) TaxID=550540 RepID=E1SP19_FERBD|nr:50S ribosomal protein L11 methyltransferase [Ferrimonas balearica]ADN74668.1 (LSU ribosomal protein L11P)-lysine N-methyltransferase [Ferrimonas balearica DSM 9799]MBW3140466.1 50S ribosomal protein L11 methyltransferase [Ferrimonas balearica]MBY5981240.1 50S ribosomal protein L11 methyltransferase [Ferrimonas balearica]MBY6096419.1 50S ribosomal protein L11 methyltransferase [Ferrimonas balearica]MBY6107724.1 50S ribosomal protein L11 methyltransferase [Ferrimonas balearica]